MNVRPTIALAIAITILFGGAMTGSAYQPPSQPGGNAGVRASTSPTLNCQSEDSGAVVYVNPLSFTVPTTSGDTLILFASDDSGSGTMPTDTQSNSWSLAVTESDFFISFVWTATAGATGSDTVQFTETGDELATVCDLSGYGAMDGTVAHAQFGAVNHFTALIPTASAGGVAFLTWGSRYSGAHTPTYTDGFLPDGYFLCTVQCGGTDTNFGNANLTPTATTPTQSVNVTLGGGESGGNYLGFSFAAPPAPPPALVSTLKVAPTPIAESGTTHANTTAILGAATYTGNLTVRYPNGTIFHAHTFSGATTAALNTTTTLVLGAIPGEYRVYWNATSGSGSTANFTAFNVTAPPVPFIAPSLAPVILAAFFLVVIGGFALFAGSKKRRRRRDNA